VDETGRVCDHNVERAVDAERVEDLTVRRQFGNGGVLK